MMPRKSTSVWPWNSRSDSAQQGASVPPDVLGGAELDTIATSTLLSYPMRQPFELRTEVVEADGALSVREPTQLGPVGGAGLVDMAGVVAVLHTHPYFTRTQGARGGFDARATNRANESIGPRDDELVTKYRVPNYFRTPTGRIKVVEIVGGKIRVRLVYDGE